MKWICPLFSIVLVAGLVGCGSDGKASVKGKVTYGAKAVKVGEVVIFGGDGVPQKGRINTDGTYEVKDLVCGECKVAVFSVNPTEALAATRDAKTPPDPQDIKNWFPIHSSYEDPNTSGQRITLKAGENEHDIQLKDLSVAATKGPRR